MPNIKLSDIIIKNNNPRSSFDQTKFSELVESIRERGILQPIICRKIGDGFELIAGNRRLEAAKRLGLSEIPVVLRDTNDEDIQADQIIENLQREEMSAEDKYQAFKSMRNIGLTVGEISKKTGVNTTVISSILALENLSPDIRSRNDIDEYPKQLIAKAPITVQLILADRVSKGELSIRCLLADILPTLNKIEAEIIFNPTEKQNTIKRVAEETIFKEYPARAIYAQEVGKKRMELAGVKPKIISSNTLEEYLIKIRAFSNTIHDIKSTHLQYLDKTLVLKLYVALRDVRDELNHLLIAQGGKNEKS